MSEKRENAYTEYQRIISEYNDTIAKMNIQEYNEPPTNDHEKRVQRAIEWDRKREKVRTDAIKRLYATGMQLDGNLPI